MIRSMKAIRVHSPGGADALALDTLPDPSPAEGQLVVRVEAAGVNFIDVYHRTGLYEAPRPIAIGREGAGTVVAVGAGVTGVREGDRVAWVGVPGSYATHVAAPVDRFIAVPDGVDTRTAAAAMLQGMTAHYLTRSTYALGDDDTALLHAAAGGVGLLVCQLGKRAGARVIGTVSTEHKEELALAAGAAYVVRYTETDFVAEVRNITGTRGCQVVYDSVGRATFDKSLECLAARGMMVSFGQSSGPADPIDPRTLAHKGSLYLTRPSLFDYIATREEYEQRAGDVLSWIAGGELDIRIDRELPLADAAEAHRLLEGRKTAGKVLLVP